MRVSIVRAVAITTLIGLIGRFILAQYQSNVTLSADLYAARLKNTSYAWRLKRAERDMAKCVPGWKCASFSALRTGDGWEIVTADESERLMVLKDQCEASRPPIAPQHETLQPTFDNPLSGLFDTCSEHATAVGNGELLLTERVQGMPGEWRIRYASGRKLLLGVNDLPAVEIAEFRFGDIPYQPCDEHLHPILIDSTAIRPPRNQ